MASKKAVAAAPQDLGIGVRDVLVLLIAVGFVIAIVAFLVEYYGRAGEPSAAGILGIIVPAIGTLASAAVGVSVGSAAGQSGGKQVAQSKSNAVASVLPEVNALMITFAKPHESRRQPRRIPGETHQETNRRIQTQGDQAPIKDDDYDADVFAQISKIGGALKALATDATTDG